MADPARPTCPRLATPLRLLHSATPSAALPQSIRNTCAASTASSRRHIAYSTLRRNLLAMRREHPTCCISHLSESLLLRYDKVLDIAHDLACRITFGDLAWLECLVLWEERITGRRQRTNAGTRSGGGGGDEKDTRGLCPAG